jgi:hypothetical protein
LIRHINWRAASSVIQEGRVLTDSFSPQRSYQATHSGDRKASRTDRSRGSVWRGAAARRYNMSIPFHAQWPTVHPSHSGQRRPCLEVRVLRLSSLVEGWRGRGTLYPCDLMRNSAAPPLR